MSKHTKLTPLDEETRRKGEEIGRQVEELVKLFERNGRKVATLAVEFESGPDQHIDLRPGRRPGGRCGRQRRAGPGRGPAALTAGAGNCTHCHRAEPITHAEAERARASGVTIANSSHPRFVISKPTRAARSVTWRRYASIFTPCIRTIFSGVTFGPEMCLGFAGRAA